MKTEGRPPVTAPDCSGRRFAIVAARFYESIADDLVAGAMQALRECGVNEERVRVFDVPGCFELPLVCRRIIDRRSFDAVIALGAVVRGETPHFEYVAGECARAIMDVQLETRVPIGFGVLTTETLEQAEVRADPRQGNKGYSAAMAAAAVLTLSVA